MTEVTTKKMRGFACMTPERRREIAKKGGASVPKEKRSFSKDPSLAMNAGRKGGSSVRVKTPPTSEPEVQPEA